MPGQHTDAPSGWVSIKLAPAALFLIVGATVIPVELRAPIVQNASFALSPFDFILNVLLFVPLGMSLGGRRWWIVAAAAGLLSIGIEILQLSQAGRYAGPSDVVANMLGGLVGSTCRRVHVGWLRVESGLLVLRRRAFIAVSLLAGVVPLAAIGVPGERYDFSNWDPGHRLAIGDELTRDRTWSGSLGAFQIYDGALERDVIRELVGQEPGQARKIVAGRTGLDALVRWDNPFPAQSSGFVELEAEAATAVHRRITASGQMSLLAWLEVKDTEDVDDGRIVTFSGDPFHRNFSLCQKDRALAFRLRTPSTGLNGMGPATGTTDVLSAGKSYFVAATYDGAVSRVFVDGDLVGRESLAAWAAAFPGLHGSISSLVIALCGGGLAGALIALVGWYRPAGGYLLGCLGGVIASAVLWVAAGASASPISLHAPLWMILPVAGGLLAALSFDERWRSPGA